MLQLCGNSSTAEKAKRVAIDGELEIHIFLSSPEHHLSIGNKPTSCATRVARTKEIVKDGNVLQTVVHVCCMTNHKIGHTCPGGRYVVDDRSASSVKGKAAALAWGRIRMEVVVVGTEF